MIRYNLHQHSIFSDGAAEPEVYVQNAIKLGFDAVVCFEKGSWENVSLT